MQSGYLVLATPQLKEIQKMVITSVEYEPLVSGVDITLAESIHIGAFYLMCFSSVSIGNETVVDLVTSSPSSDDV